MNRKLLIVILGVVAVCAAGVLLWRFLFAESPEHQIRRTFQELSATARKTGKEGLIVAMEKARDTARFFDDVCTLKLDRIPNGVGAMSRQNITANTLTLRNYFRTMKVTFYDMEILVDREKPEAQATFTAVFEGDPSSGRPVCETKEMDAGLVRKQDRWLLTSLAFRDVIRK